MSPTKTVQNGKQLYASGNVYDSVKGKVSIKGERALIICSTDVHDDDVSHAF